MVLPQRVPVDPLLVGALALRASWRGLAPRLTGVALLLAVAVVLLVLAPGRGPVGLALHVALGVVLVALAVRDLRAVRVARRRVLHIGPGGVRLDDGPSVVRVPRAAIRGTAVRKVRIRSMDRFDVFRGTVILEITRADSAAPVRLGLPGFAGDEIARALAAPRPGRPVVSGDTVERRREAGVRRSLPDGPVTFAPQGQRVATAIVLGAMLLAVGAAALTGVGVEGGPYPIPGAVFLLGGVLFLGAAALVRPGRRVTVHRDGMELAAPDAVFVPWSACAEVRVRLSPLARGQSVDWFPYGATLRVVPAAPGRLPAALVGRDGVVSYSLRGTDAIGLQRLLGAAEQG